MVKPWRTVILSKETGRFTREQLRDAVRAVKAERAESPEHRERPTSSAEVRPAAAAKPRARAAERRRPPTPRTKPTTHHPRRPQESRMSSKPWRTVIISKETGRFTREQIRDAVLAVKAETEERERLRAANRNGRPGRRPVTRSPFEAEA